MGPSVHAVVLCGGAGTRLWPLSRNETPKQFLSLGGRRNSLLQNTIRRLGNISPIHNRWLVLPPHHERLAREQVGFEVEHVLVEPEPRNTAPAVALAVWSLLHHDPDAIMIILAADHAIQPIAKFEETMARAIRLAAEDRFVVVGIRPTFPATGFGYIEVGNPIPGTDGAESDGFDVQRFKEKPDQNTAEAFLRQGNFLWNAGMFVWKARTFWDTFREVRPEFARAFESRTAGDLPTIYARLPREPIDIAFVEKAPRVACVPALFDWNDVGSWAAVRECFKQDADGNVSAGDVALFGTRNSVVHSTGPFVATVGLTDAVVVATPDAVLVTTRSASGDVPQVVEHLMRCGRHELL